jgi:hypothetical protein
MKTTKQMDKILIEKFADNGEHSHYEIINKDGSESDLIVLEKEKLRAMLDYSASLCAANTSATYKEINKAIEKEFGITL